MLHGHGDDWYDCQRDIVSNFSSNVLARQNLSALHEHLCGQLGRIHRYPEPDAASLARMLAKKEGIPVDNVTVTAGATEAVYLVAQLRQGGQSAILIPTFGEYGDACRIYGHSLGFIKNPGDLPPETDTVWICNPNNPDGRVFNKEALAALVAQHPHILFVIDQSYEYFTDQAVWSAREALSLKNAITLHSLTKRYAIPGLRIGYMTAASSLINEIKRIRMPWSVNGVAIAAGEYLLGQSGADIPLNDYLRETRRLMSELNGIEGVDVLPSRTHFFLCRLREKAASDLKAWLIEHHGILIRDASNFKGLDGHYFRIAAQTPPENDRLIKAIKAWMQGT